MTTPITLVIRDSMLIISNPGGLCGVSIENLGKTASHSRNEWLTHICQSISTVDGESVVERIGSGIPTVIFALESEFRPSARFFDEGIRFTVILTGGEPQIDGVVSNLYDIDSQIKGTLPNLNDTGQPKNHEVIYKLLQKESPLTRAEIMRKTGISDSKSRYALRKLLAENLVKILDNQNSPIAHYAPSAHPSKR
jgi:ATP-dependent DNA helicase RecG